MTTEEISSVAPARWVGDARSGYLELLDQRMLPSEEVWVPVRTAEATADAIRDMVVRGAPAIGLTAAYGVVLAAQEVGDAVDMPSLEGAFERLAASRPTAVNLAWALDVMRAVVTSEGGETTLDALFDAAEKVRADDLAANRAMGDHGASLLPDGARVLTICNTGSLATAGYGTALGVVRSAWRRGRLREVLACETRPYLQGARLTMWELAQDRIPASLITDSMAGWMMATGRVDAVIAGADRVAANGDVANKIGTYALAVLAHHHELPFYIAAPTSTLDPATPTGASIPIEQRSAREVTHIGDRAIAPEGADALHPAFDVTPAHLIRAIITERGVATAPWGPSLHALLHPA